MVIESKDPHIHFERDYLYLFVKEVSYKIKLSEVSPKLAAASNRLRNNYTISPSGYGIHWAELDEDLTVNGLIKQAAR